jgi:hypothetical protein
MGAATCGHITAPAHALEVHADLFGVRRIGDLGDNERREGERHEDD